MTYAEVCQLAAQLPGIEEGTCYGTPGLRVRGKFLSRLWEDGDTLVLKVEEEERDLLLAAEPEVFFTTDHYRNYPSVLIRLSKIEPGALHDLLERAWRRVASKKLCASTPKMRLNTKSVLGSAKTGSMA